MLNKDRYNQVVGHGLIDSPKGFLKNSEVKLLWQIFIGIVDFWSGKENKNNPEFYYGQWHEFLMLNTHHSPSYLKEYRNGLVIYKDLINDLEENIWEVIFVNHKLNIYPKYKQDPKELSDRSTRLGHFKIYVVDEFIEVFLSSGGFLEFGMKNGLKNINPKNYNSYMFQSRFNK